MIKFELKLKIKYEYYEHYFMSKNNSLSNKNNINY